VIFILTFMRFVFGLYIGKNPFNMYILFIIFAIVCVSMGIWLVSLFKKPIGAYLTIFLMATPLVMLGGCYWPRELMPDIMNNIARFVPTSWVMLGVEKIIYDGKGILDITLEIIVLFVFSGIFLAAGLLRKVDVSG